MKYYYKFLVLSTLPVAVLIREMRNIRVPMFGVIIGIDINF